MNAFDIIAEHRYEEWLERISASDYQPPAPVRDTVVRKSYEGHVFSEVVSHLEKAFEADTAQKRTQLLNKAGQLELQLILLLEKRRMPLAAATMRSSLQAHRERLLLKDQSDRQQGFPNSQRFPGV